MSGFFTYLIIVLVNFCFLNPIQSKEQQMESKAPIQSKEQQMESKAKVVVLETNLGTIELQLFPEIAPKACENFVKLVEKKYYDGVIFHRVIKDFMIQGGDPEGTGMGGQSIWGKPFEDEVKEEVQFNKKGLLAMANAGPCTNGSQFFITTNKTPWLHKKHTIFGEVVGDYKTVQEIEKSKTNPRNDRPIDDIKILKAYLKSN